MIDRLLSTGDTEHPYKDLEDCHYESKTSFLASELGFCGCGDNQEVLGYVRDMLLKFNNSDWNSYRDLPYMFFAYWGNDKHFLEHGTTARCSWLTDLGKELISDIEWCLENEKELE